MSEVISKESLRYLIDEWLRRGLRVVGPVKVGTHRVFYAPLSTADQVLCEGPLRPANTIKDFVFPRHEKLFSYRLSGNTVELFDPEDDMPGQILLAARPCEAAALPVLDHVFNWDFDDEFYSARRRKSTVVTLGCTSQDDSCFCTSVNLAPDSARGSDAMLLDAGDGSFEVRCFTDKGRALFDGRTRRSETTVEAYAGPQKRFDAAEVRTTLGRIFESPFWGESTLACLGCGACAFTCPTCHCFDMVDEGSSYAGARVRNWDSCQFALFTLHASGHNPRASQPQRQRQRLYHKFRIYPEKFGEILCTGCGNCSRNCPAGLGVLSVLSSIGHEQHI